MVTLQNIRNGINETKEYAKHLGVETVKTGVLGYAFYESVKYIQSLSNLTELEIADCDGVSACVLAPVIEEILFRGFLLTAFKVSQFAWSKIRNHQRTPQHLQNQKVFRVRVVAVLFGLAHVSNGISTQIILAGIGGLTYGYIAEKTNSCATPMILHFANNFIVQAVYLSVLSPGVGTCAYILLKIFNMHVSKCDGSLSDGAVLMARNIQWCGEKAGTGFMKTARTGARIGKVVLEIPQKFVNSTHQFILPRHLLAVG